MALTPEKRAYFDAKYGRKAPQVPKPTPPAKVVVSEGRVVAPAEVRVSPADFNFPGSRSGVVRINLAAAERQWEQAQAEKARWRKRQKELDPFGYGHWGPRED